MPSVKLKRLEMFSCSRLSDELAPMSTATALALVSAHWEKDLLSLLCFADFTIQGIHLSMDFILRVSSASVKSRSSEVARSTAAWSSSTNVARCSFNFRLFFILSDCRWPAALELDPWRKSQQALWLVLVLGIVCWLWPPGRQEIPQVKCHGG